MAKAREFLVNCDIRDRARNTFGGAEYSDDSLTKAKAARANYSVDLTFAEDTYSARWKMS